jgi:methylglutaconyl-CoA hydratase
VAEFHRALDEVKDARARVLVITGAGEKAFVSGADIRAIQARRRDDALASINSRLMTAVESHDAVTIAAVNGYALGGGCELALACDLRIAAENAVFGLPEPSLGIIPGAGGTQRLARLVGEGRATEMICLARRLAAPEALAWGLVNKVASDGASLLDETVAWLAPVAEGAPIAQGAALKAIRASYDVPLARGLELESVYYDETLRSQDRLEALAAFAEKRKPAFKGE